MASSDPRLLLLHPDDNVLVARRPIPAGEEVMVDGSPVRLTETLRLGHKLARRAVAPEEAIRKYGAPIGYATVPIRPGDHVHLHNVRSGYTPSVALDASDAAALAGSDGPGPYRQEGE